MLSGLREVLAVFPIALAVAISIAVFFGRRHFKKNMERERNRSK